jgi:hypothetical protein
MTFCAPFSGADRCPRTLWLDVAHNMRMTRMTRILPPRQSITSPPPTEPPETPRLPPLTHGRQCTTARYQGHKSLTEKRNFADHPLLAQSVWPKPDSRPLDEVALLRLMAHLHPGQNCKLGLCLLPPRMLVLV